MKVWRFIGPNSGAYAYVRVPFWLVGWFRRNVLPKHPGMYEVEPWMSGPRSLAYRAQFIMRPKPHPRGVTPTRGGEQQ